MTNKINASVSKDLKFITITVPMECVNSTDPSITDKGNASIIGYDTKFDVSIDVNGITLPINGNVGMWVTKKNWKSFTNNRDGIKEGNKQGTNVTEIDALTEMIKAQQAQIDALVKALGGAK